MRVLILLLTALIVNAQLPSGELAIHGHIQYGNITGKIELKNVTYTFQNVTYTAQNATYTVQLLDTSIMDSPAPVIASTTGPAKKFPIAYKIIYNETAVANRPSFALQATIKDSTGKLLLFTNNLYISVIPSGTDRTKTMDIPVIRVDGSVVVEKRDIDSKRIRGIKRTIAERVRMAMGV